MFHANYGRMRMPHWKYLLGFCLAVDEAAGQFIPEDSYGNPNYPDLRVAGYAAAYHGGFVDEIVLFGPTHESTFMRSRLTCLGVPSEVIAEHDTQVSTYGNGVVMKQFVQDHNIPWGKAIMSSSAYHIRAPYFGHENGIQLEFVPAEAFLFAVRPQDEKPELFRNLTARFGGGELVHRFVSEIQGIGDNLAGRYRVPTIGKTTL